MPAYLRSASCAFLRTRDEWSEFSNFRRLDNPIAAGPYRLDTSEHLYQAAKYASRPDIQDRIAASTRPGDAARLGRHPDPGPDPGWNDQRIDVMRWVIRMKREADPGLIDNALERTGHRPIVEISHRDSFWGARPAGEVYEGDNVLGRLWMELRHQVRENDPLALASAWEPRIQIGALSAVSGQQIEGNAVGRPTYAGIGARQTPEPVLQQMGQLASDLADRGWHLHSGGTAGADTAFASAVPAHERTQFLPWASFNGLSGPDCHVSTEDITARHMVIAASLHPAWDRCDATARQFHARNVSILLGADGDAPVDAVVCWTPRAETVGGTGIAIRIADAHGIPVINLAATEPHEALDHLIAIQQSRSPALPAHDFETAEHKFRAGASPSHPNGEPAAIVGTYSGYPIYRDESGVTRLAVGSGNPERDQAQFHARLRTASPDPIDPALEPRIAEISRRLGGLLPEPGERDGPEERLGHVLRRFFDLARVRPHILEILDRLSANRDLIRPGGFVNEPLLDRLEHLARYPTIELANALQRDHLPQSTETIMSDRTRRLSDEHDDGWAEPSYEPEQRLQSDELAEDRVLYGDPDAAGDAARRLPGNRTIDGVVDLDRDEEHVPPDWVRQMEAEAAEHAIPTATARITDELALFGPGPLAGEHDDREVWINLDQPIAFDAARPPHIQAAFDQVGESLENLLDAVTPHGFQMADEREGLLWGLVNALDHQAKLKEKAVGQLSQQVMELRRTESQRIREQGRDPASLELEEKTHHLRSAAAKQEVFEHLRDYAADFYFHENHKVWEARGKATQTSQSENVATQISGKDFLRAQAKHLPIPDIPENGTLIAVAGAKIGPSHETIIKRLDAQLEQTPDMILAHGGARGVQSTAASWAKRNDVPEIVFLPEFDKYPNNAIMRRDDQMLMARPELVISFTAEGQRLPRLHTGALERGIDVDPVSDRYIAAAATREARCAAQGLCDRHSDYDPSVAPRRSPDPSPHQGYIDEQKREVHADRYAAGFLDPDYAPARHATPAEQATADAYPGKTAASPPTEETAQARRARPQEQATADAFLGFDHAGNGKTDRSTDLTVSQAVDTLLDAALPRNDQLSEDTVRCGDDDRHPIRTALFARFINAFHSLTSGPGSAADQLSDHAHRARQLEREDTHSEIDINRQAENREHTRYAETSLGSLEHARAQLASHFHEETGRHWTPPAPDEIPNGRNLNSASVDALNLVERLRQQRHEARLPQGVPIVVTALQEGPDRDTVFAQLDRVRAKKPDMYIAHGNAPGVLQDVSDWAKSRKVEEVHFNLDYSVPAQLRIIKRDEAILDINPVGVVEFRNGEKTTHLADEARRNKIPVFPVRSTHAPEPTKTEQHQHQRSAARGTGMSL